LKREFGKYVFENIISRNFRNSNTYFLILRLVNFTKSSVLIRQFELLKFSRHSAFYCDYLFSQQFLPGDFTKHSTNSRSSVFDFDNFIANSARKCHKVFGTYYDIVAI
jgi:hypothetical protein